MYDYHLWIILRESTEESDCGSLHKKINDLQHLADQKLICKPSMCIHDINYSVVMQCSGGANHRGNDHQSLLEVLEWIAEALPGSYGLVYWSDDEIPGRSIFDGYRVIILARGRLEERCDPFLSPIAPIVEDC